MQYSRSLVAAFVALFVCVAIARAAPVPAGPHATAAEIRALHGTTATSGKRLTFSDAVEGEAAVEMAVDLTGDFIVIGRAGRRAIVDFKLRRHFVLDDAKQTFTNASLFADIGFRTYEFQNRMMMGKIAAKTNLPPKGLSVFETQAQIGLTLPSVPLEKIERKNDSGVERLTHNGTEVARVRYSDTRFQGDELKAYARFLHRGIVLHPGIVEALLADGRIPAEFTYARQEGFDTKKRTLTLKSVEVRAVEYLPAAYAQGTPDFGPKFRGAEMMSAIKGAVAGTLNGGPRSAAAYRKAIEASIGTRPLQTMLLINEMLLHHGVNACPKSEPKACDAIRAFMLKAGADSEVQDLVRGLEAGGRGDGRGTPYFSKLKREGLSNAYLLDIYIANDKRGADAPELFQNGIRGNPYVPGFYKDFGDYWYRNYQTEPAWFLFDVARTVPDAPNVQLMFDQIDRVEGQFVRDFPQFF